MNIVSQHEIFILVMKAIFLGSLFGLVIGVWLNRKERIEKILFAALVSFMATPVFITFISLIGLGIVSLFF